MGAEAGGGDGRERDKGAGDYCRLGVNYFEKQLIKLQLLCSLLN